MASRIDFTVKRLVKKESLLARWIAALTLITDREEPRYALDVPASARCKRKKARKRRKKEDTRGTLVIRRTIETDQMVQNGKGKGDKGRKNKRLCGTGGKAMLIRHGNMRTCRKWEKYEHAELHVRTKC